MTLQQISFQYILEAREKRAERQQEMLIKFSKPIISFTLNIPGATKNNNLYKKVHYEGIQAIKKALIDNSIEINEIQIKNTAAGSEALLSCNANAILLKTLLVNIEENHELGRLFDMDILEENGHIIGRTRVGIASRKCFLCDKAAQICARSKTHSIEELNNTIYSKINSFFNKQL